LTGRKDPPNQTNLSFKIMIEYFSDSSIEKGKNAETIYSLKEVKY
jgi:hypothetical protein